MKTTKILCLLLAVFVAFGTTSCKKKPELPTDNSPKAKTFKRSGEGSIEFMKQCDAKFAAQFTPDIRKKADTARDEDNYTDTEKQVFYYLNLARLAPQTFAKTYAKAYEGLSGYENDATFDSRKASLLQELAVAKPMPLLEPDEDLTETADCFATEAGRRGLRGHGRADTGCTRIAGGECIQYSLCRTGLDVVMELLVDAGAHNADLGHRRNCLRPDFHYLGVAIRPHKVTQQNAVLDFAI